MFMLKRDVTDPFETPIVKFSKFGPNMESLIGLDGQNVSQEPNVYGKFNSSPNDGPYEKCKVNGQLVTFWTRPQDIPYTYVWVELPNS